MTCRKKCSARSCTVRWRANSLDALIDDIAANQYGLTLGIHSRIDATVEHVVARLAHGNVYVNRNMIERWSAPSRSAAPALRHRPQGRRPNYLRRFVTEQVVTINTAAAAGGNASLLATEE